MEMESNVKNVYNIDETKSNNRNRTKLSISK